VAHICSIKLGGPHLDTEMWETMNLNPLLFVLSNSEFLSFPDLKIQTWVTRLLSCLAFLLVKFVHDFGHYIEAVKI
jgi:hypothetical protein